MGKGRICESCRKQRESTEHILECKVVQKLVKIEAKQDCLKETNNNENLSIIMKYIRKCIEKESLWMVREPRTL